MIFGDFFYVLLGLADGCFDESVKDILEPRGDFSWDFFSSMTLDNLDMFSMPKQAVL